MAPQLRLKELNAINIEERNPKKAAVLILLYPDVDLQTNFVLIHRKKYPGTHSGQISFPGGKVEKKDIDLRATALRETHEEIGVSSEKIKLIRSLSEVYIPPSNFMVYPFMGITNEFPVFSRQESEVEQIVEVPLANFMDDTNVYTEELTTFYAKNITVPVFKLNGHVVWGATAMMLSEVKELLKHVL